MWRMATRLDNAELDCGLILNAVSISSIQISLDTFSVSYYYLFDHKVFDLITFPKKHLLQEF